MLKNILQQSRKICNDSKKKREKNPRSIATFAANSEAVNGNRAMDRVELKRSCPIIRLSCRKLFRKKETRRGEGTRDSREVLAVAVTPLLYTYEMDVGGAGGIKWMESEVRS